MSNTGIDFDGDFHMTADIDADWSTVSEQVALLEALFRRLSERARGLFYDPNYGTLVKDFLSAAISEDRMIALMIAECRKEDAVNDVFIEVQPNGDFDITVDSAFGELSFTLARKNLVVDDGT